VSERVVNLRDFPPTIHLGRSGKFVKSRVLPPDVVRIDRTTRWGNPFKIGDIDLGNGVRVTREAAIEMYRVSLATDLLYWPGYLEPLRGKRFACWCAPLPCHGDVIAELIP
jgi:hypothetical protein